MEQKQEEGCSQPFAVCLGPSPEQADPLCEEGIVGRARWLILGHNSKTESIRRLRPALSNGAPGCPVEARPDHSRSGYSDESANFRSLRGCDATNFGHRA